MATTQLEPRLYALPGSFPGLELLTLTLMSWTGAPALVATRLVTLVLHAMIPVLALAIARGLGLPGRLAAIAALVYAANTSYLFFHSVYSYETLGITLFLGAWVVVVAWLREPVPIASRLLIGAVPLVAGLTVTHHLSSYLLVACLALASLVVWRRRDRRARALGVLTGIAAALAVGWFVVNVGFLGPYLAGTLADRVGVILETLVADRSQPRSLFANSPLPVADRVVAILYPILVFSTSAAGLLAGFLLRRRGHLRSPAWIVLAVVGPVAWLASTPAVVTRGAELAYRSWPFLFLGVAPIAALGIGAISGWLGRRQGMGWAVAARGVAPILVALLLAGGFVIGDNQAGRFPVDRPMTAAGPANVTDDVLAAARWLRATAGEDHIVATDSGSAVTFSTDGGQRILRWNDWYPFITPDVDKVLPFLLETHTEFLVVDLQVTELPPRYGAYYGPPAIPPDRDPGQPIPAALLFRLDDVPGLERIYDGGRVRIYAVTSATGGGR